MKKVSVFLASIAICFLFTTNSFANENLTNDSVEPIVEVINCESLVTTINFNPNETLIKDGKFWRGLRDFIIGVGKGLGDGPMPISNSGNDTNMSDEEIKDFAIKHIRNKENAFRVYQEVQKLILNEKEIVNKEEVLNVFKPQNQKIDSPHSRFIQKILDDIFKKTTIDKELKTRSNPRKSQLSKRSIKNLKTRKYSIKDRPNGEGEALKSKINWKRVGWIVGRILKHIL